jgi:hypothetical protein
MTPFCPTVLPPASQSFFDHLWPIKIYYLTPLRLGTCLAHS